MTGATQNDNGDHITTRYDLIYRMWSRMLSLFERADTRGVLLFLIALMIGFGCFVAVTILRDASTNAASAAVAARDVASKQGAADIHREDAFRMMAKVPDQLDQQTKLLQGIAENQRAFAESQKVFAECLRRLTDKVESQTKQ